MQPEDRRRHVADTLRMLADVVEAEIVWKPSEFPDEIEYEPPIAAVIVMFDAYGEPAPLVVGCRYMGHTAYEEILHDAEQAIVGIAHFPEHRIRIRETWEQTEEIREVRRVKAAEEERTHPAACPDCDRRFKSDRGLEQHQRASGHGE